MFAVYLSYGKPTTIHRLTLQGEELVQTIEPGTEQHLVDCKEEDHLVRVVTSWLKDPDTLGVRVERKEA